MTESLCSCCQLLGKPPGQINFIIATGVPDSVVYQRIKYLLENNSENSSWTSDIRLKHYETLMDINNQLFNLQNHSLPMDQSISTSTRTCCDGYTAMSIDIDDISNSSRLDKFQKTILELLDPTIEKKYIKRKLTSWILFSGSICLEPALLNIFLQLTNQNSSLRSFTLTVLCFLVDEKRLFENWLFQNLSIQDYQLKTLPEYQHQINNFFSLLNSSKYLQDNTLLVEEQTVLTDSTLQTFMQGVFRNESSKYRANNDKFRCDMAKLLSPRQRTVRDVRDIRIELVKRYNWIIADRLKPLLNDLQRSSTAVNAARQIVHLVLDDFERMNDEELRVYKRQLIHGFKTHDAEDTNTIAAQLVRYALELLRNNNADTSTPLIYSIISVICTLGSHFYSRHELFNHTPEIYTLSLLLVSQRQYALTLSGLRLCNTILYGDQNEHKYAIAYLTHDPLTARKILDAIKWLLSPYQTLKNLWKEEEEGAEKGYDGSE
ncbi:unnamed protein product [Rotaria sp. Silwood2]|nr:unnamed protein product [Rotaria sp. Silwood2]CAF3920174.1 unnamed protein product [Rotaria sp. Silwood2]